MSVANQKYQPTIALVFGYLLNIDYRPKIASANNLKQRFSIAFDSYNPQTKEIYFDIDMFENIFSSFFSQVKFDLIEITYQKEKKFIFKDFDEAFTIIKEKKELENELFNNMLIYRHEKLICYIEVENYTLIGGPYPYHDTFNFAFFFNEINQDFLSMIKKVCKENKYLIRLVENGLSNPKSTLMNQFKKFFLE